MTASRHLSQRAQTRFQPIGELMRLALARPELISLAAGFVDQASLPVNIARQAVDWVLADRQRGQAALQYGTNSGYAPLRELILERFIAAEKKASPPATIENIILTAGSNQLLHLLGEVLLDPGDIVLCAAPTYFVFLGMVGAMRARAIGVASDRDGMIPAALEERLRQHERRDELSRVKAIYVTSYFDNPSTATLPAERRRDIVAIAKRFSTATPIFVIDDVAYRDLRFSGDALPSLRAFDDDGSTVVVADTFSKSFSPGVRVGWGILPASLVEPIAGLKANIDFGSPNLNQYLMHEVLTKGIFDPHVVELRHRYEQKLAAMLEAMDDFLAGLPGVSWRAPTGGLYVWLELPPGMDAGPAGALMHHALEEGVLYVPGEYCYPEEGEPRRHDRIRLSFGVQSAANLRRGIEALGRAIRSTLGEAKT